MEEKDTQCDKVKFREVMSYGAMVLVPKGVLFL